ncbi:hypothetical protein GWI33_007905 [Rhynchophorus ferrugineus]|uniref:Uncharacterized protein n=1 Tax=Rhynchophorus ferrugineus TaxID=354439 RepID=A0A834IGY2_RHYFE|nr:hypothetical protein GWI33_007905 [Rhynchophorus ferrugineus]
MDKKEFRVLIKYCFLKGKNTVEAKTWLYSECCEMSTKRGERSGRPKEVVTDINIKKIHKMILNERKLKLYEIVDTLKISTERVHYIIHEYLDMRKLCAKWVLRELTFDQKQRRVDDSDQCVKMIKHNKPELLNPLHSVII